MSRKAFTLVELLVVVAISALLSTLAITYSSVGRNAVSLSVESAKIAEFILQAKQLSISTYTGASLSCGYGVVFNIAAQTYSIFAYAPSGVFSCRQLPASSIGSRGIGSGEEQLYTPGTWRVHLSSGVVLRSPSPQVNNLVTVLFYPPAPTVFLSNDGMAFASTTATLTVNLVTADGKNSAVISVNPEGQVNF